MNQNKTKRVMKKISLYFCLFFIGFTLQAQENIIPLEIKNHVRARVEAGLNVGIVIGFIDGEEIQYFSYGKTALTNGSEVDENSVFEIGSISKTFTAIMLADAIIKGDMAISDPISKFLPEGVSVPSRNARVISLKDLVTHSSGLPRLPDNLKPSNMSNPYADYTTAQAYAFLSGHKLSRDIGEKFEYSNYGMGLLGHLLELKYGVDYETLMMEKITNPLAMNHTRVVFTPAMKNQLAKGHANGQEVQNWDLPALAGAGAIRSTANDMLKFLKANMGMTTAKIQEAMQMSHEQAYENQSQNFKMGMGWHYAKDAAIIWHNGGTGGYVSFAGFLKGTKKGVVVLTNTAENVDAIGLKLLDDTRQLKMPKISIANALEKEINTNGLTKGIAFYRTAKAEAPDTYNFGVGELNRLGYSYIALNNLETAIALFKLNVEMFPKTANPYDSLGEAYLKQGDSILAITNYKKAFELNPANIAARDLLLRLGVPLETLKNEISVSEETLETYVGDYEIQPGFIISVRRKDRHLFIQATGQAQFEVFASAKNKFYLKAVEANITFNTDAIGKIDSLTLHQGGQDIPGKKIE